MNPKHIRTTACLAALLVSATAACGQTITLKSLLAEMTDPDAVARLPQPAYQCLQASSYNRASTNRHQPNQDTSGWFADSDGLGFIRTEMINGKKEWVMMEHTGPGCLTKFWTPFFYHAFGERVGANVRIYLDGAETPVIDESLIRLVRGEGTFRPPLATPTARAGDSYAPIPFAKSCKVTMTDKPFYNIINYRAYPAGTPVETFTRAGYDAAAADLAKAGQALTALPEANKGSIKQAVEVKAGGMLEMKLPEGANAVRQFTVRMPGATQNPATLRSTVLAMTFDGEETVWCPLGDFFCSADSLHPMHTWQRTVTADGTLVCRWVMPYQKSASLRVLNLGGQPVQIELLADVARWDWDDRSMHFHANWRPDDVVPGTPFQDWNYIDIRGQGVFVGDAWTVLNIQGSWWGEGDEKIYVDDAWDKGFPTHFGTGTEDYYGWAGGVVPTRQDEFSVPFLANPRVGGLDGRTTGFNICTRTRSLDAIPFAKRLVFDMESSFGTDIRKPWNLLGYSAVTFWYARPGATHNRPALPEAAARPIMSLAEVKAKSDAIRKPAKSVRAIGAGGYEFESLKPTAASPNLGSGPQRPAEKFNPSQWSGEEHYFIPAKQAGDFVEFTFTEQFTAKTLILHLTTSFDFGVATISVNGKPALEKADLFSAEPAVKAVNLGRHVPVNNRFVLRCELVAPNARARGARTFMGLDSLVLMEDALAKPAAPSAAPRDGAAITLDSLLAEMINRDTVAKWPVPAYTLRQSSSYDRATKDPADAKGWFANKDYEQFIRTEQNDGRREWVILEHEGPGALTRFWLPLHPPKDKQIIRFYFDGSPTPAIAVPFNELLSGRSFVKPPFAFVSWDETNLHNQLKAPPKTMRGVGGDLYLPIPFARSCKITLDQLPFYYIINYRAYEPGTAVETFSMAGYEAAKAALEKTGEILLGTPNITVAGSAKPVTLAPNEEVAVSLPPGPSAVRNLHVQVDPKDAPQVVRSTVLTAEFDGEPAIWCPLGEFFGCGARLNPVQDWFRTVQEDGTLFAHWIMPYQRTGRLTLKNLGAKPVTVSLAARTAPWAWDDRSMIFHANWRGTNAMKTRPMSDWNYIEIKGRGVYVGDTLTVFSPVSAWYGEGDEKVYLDGEAFPSHIGTGTEDYYGYAWGMATFFNSPFISTPRRDSKSRESWKGYTTTSRVRLLDGYPLRTSLRLDMEIWNWADTKVDYAVGAFWYARPGATHNRQPQPAEAAEPLREFPTVSSLRGAIECEGMKVLSHTEGLRIGRQENYPFDTGAWSGDAQLFVQARQPGNFVELLLAENVTGPRKITLHATQSHDYGILRFSVNGQAVDKVFDGQAPRPMLSGPVELGTFEPKEGKFVLRIEVTGANPASTGPKYYFGLDAVILTAP